MVTCYSSLNGLRLTKYRNDFSAVLYSTQKMSKSSICEREQMECLSNDAIMYLKESKSFLHIVF